MKTPPSVAHRIGFALFKKLLPGAFLVGTAVLLIPVFLLWQKYKIEALRVLICLILATGLFAALFTSREIVFRMEEDQSTLFSDALAHTLYRYLTYLCFIPVIGPAIQRFLEERRRKNPFTSDEA